MIEGGQNGRGGRVEDMGEVDVERERERGGGGGGGGGGRREPKRARDMEFFVTF